MIDVDGDGLLNNFYNYISKSTTDALRKRPPQLNDLLSVRGGEEIYRIQICRKELSNKIKWLINTFTMWELKKQMKKFNYDKLYHLYLVIYLKDGCTFAIEKNDRIKIRYNPIIDNKSECKIYTLAKPIKLYNFIENGEKRGGVDFYRYSAHMNNCQKFVNILLVSNGITAFSSFIMQNVNELFTESYRRIFQGITDAAGYAKYLMGGDGDEDE